MHRISDSVLIQALNRAKQIDLDEDFINLLKKEADRRQLWASILNSRKIQ